MSTFQLTNKAKSDLKSIASYTQRKWGPQQRRFYLKQLDDAFHLLATSPDFGTACDYIKTGYLKFPVTSHVVYYRALSNEKIEVVRVLHKRMDPESQLKQP